MIHIHILSGGFKGANGSAFLYPFVRYRRSLHDAGIDVRILTKEGSSTAECDCLFIDSKHYRDREPADRDHILERLTTFARTLPVCWFDASDSTGTLQSFLIDHVARYFKAQLLVDRSLYTQDLYGDRVVSDYYHRVFGVEDDDPTRVGPPLLDAQLEKLGVSWNSGLGDYSRWGASYVRAYSKTHFAPLLRAPRHWTPASRGRKHALSGRFGVGHRKPTIRFQRQKLREVIGDRVSVNKISRPQFLKELRESFAVVSPFGWGEITLRDFEVFINGGLLVKPDMSHLETWPPLYVKHETYLPLAWDFSDAVETLDWIGSHQEDAEQMAVAGQETYKAYLASPWGRDQFVQRLRSMLSTL